MALILSFQGKTPNIADDAFVAPNATIIGDVTVGAGASIWYGAVVRGDSGRVVIGSGTNVQDNAVVHVNDRDDTIIGDNVTVGHAAVLEGCTIGEFALIGMNATVLSGSTIGRYAVIAAGSVVREGADVPDKTLAAGVPAKVRGEISAELLKRISEAPSHYVKYGALHQEEIDSAESEP